MVWNTMFEPRTSSVSSLIVRILPSAKSGSGAPGSASYAVSAKAASGPSEPSAVAATTVAPPPSTADLSRSLLLVIAVSSAGRDLARPQAAERLAMRLKAAGVRSISRLSAQVAPQQLRSPQNRSVCGPQSAIVVTTLAPPHNAVVRWRKPQVRRDSPTPHRSGRVIDQQASEVLGQACWRLPELQVPHAPLPVLLHGPPRGAAAEPGDFACDGAE
ncbi:hypothetical protein ACFSTC_00245 [Nonomuraea ferruginea]